MQYNKQNSTKMSTYTVIANGFKFQGYLTRNLDGFWVVDPIFYRMYRLNEVTKPRTTK